jgi:hypothetical protein
MKPRFGGNLSKISMTTRTLFHPDAVPEIDSPGSDQRKSQKVAFRWRGDAGDRTTRVTAAGIHSHSVRTMMVGHIP